MTAWFNRKKHARRASYVTIHEYTYSSLPKPSPKWSGKAKAAFVIAASGAFLYFLVSGDLGIIKLFTMHKLNDELKAEELAIAAQVVDLDTRKRLLESDTLFIEQVARTEFQMSRPGETVYEIAPKPAHPQKQ
jgi:cell division protein FtsB